MAESESERTRRESGRDDGPAVTRRDGSPVVEPLVRLPGELAGRFSVVGELAALGAESDLVRVRDSRGVELVIKVFRRGFRADREVWRKLPTLESAHVVRIVETGHAEGRDYEVLEYLPAGNLKDAGVRGPIAEIVAQLAEALRVLHGAGIVHRDLKPENILVRAAEPVEVAVADFGLSRVIEQSVVFASSSRTLAYAAPESLSGQVSPARDWWSLGIIVRELVTGRAPYAGMSETTVVDHLATRTIDCSDISDGRIRLLCQGLLTRDPRRRWSAGEVTDWLNGESPAVLDSPAKVSGGLEFSGRTYTSPEDLARALVADWDTAARYFFGTMFTPAGPSEAWQALRGWLIGDGRAQLIDEWLTSAHSPDVKLYRLLRWLDPSLPPYLCGVRVDEPPALAAQVDDDPRAARAVRVLWEQGLLEDDHTAARWRSWTAKWNELAEWLRTQLPQAADRLPPATQEPAVLATLLALAGKPEETQRALVTAAGRARDRIAAPVPWFAWLSEQAGDDPLRLLAMIRAAPAAMLAAEGAARQRYEAEQRTAEGDRRWAERERERLAGKRQAMIRAVLWTLPFAVLWFGGSLLAPHVLDSAGLRSASGSTGTRSDPTVLLLVVALLAWAADTAAEVLLAARQGTDYLPLGPWSGLARVLRGTGRGLAGASRRMSGTRRSTGCGPLLLLGIIPVFVLFVLFATLLSIAWLLWLAVMIVVPLGHVVASGVRLQNWRQEQARAKALTVEGRQ